MFHNRRLTSTGKLIEKIWAEAGAWPEFVQVMRLALQSRDETGRDPSAWAELPGLCCQAAGGKFAWADPIAAAWLMLYTAAHLMDSVEDCDPPDPWWQGQGPAAALNAATGLYFSACLALQELEQPAITSQTAHVVRQEVLRPFLRMSSGQYSDSLHPASSLDEYWRIASAKSGAFFALACRAGARLASNSTTILAGYEQYGLALGCMVQVLDDLADFRDLSRPGHQPDVSCLQRSLPAIYIQEVSPSEACERFNRLIPRAADDPSALQEMVEIIEENGGVLYMLSELSLQANRARAGLDAAQPAGPERQQLENWIAVLHP